MSITEQEIRERVSKTLGLYGEDWNQAARDIFDFCCELHGVDRRTRGQRIAECIVHHHPDHQPSIILKGKTCIVGPDAQGFVRNFRRELAAIIDTEIATTCKERDEALAKVAELDGKVRELVAALHAQITS